MFRILISPAKKMQTSKDSGECPLPLTTPVFQEQADFLQRYLQTLSFEELHSMWNCSEKLASQTYERLFLSRSHASASHTKTDSSADSPSIFSTNPARSAAPVDTAGTAALLSYEGLQYQYMAPQIFSDTQWKYVAEHLRILSGFYGILRPTDTVRPYRLEMQARFPHPPEHTDFRTVYDFWGDRIAGELSGFRILNLASAEYSKAVLPWIPKKQVVTVVFGELSNGKIRTKGTWAKMARGELVRQMAERHIIDLEEIKKFHVLDYYFSEEHSSKETYTFLLDQKTVVQA